MDIQKAMKQAQSMQSKMLEMQKKMEQEKVNGSSGGGLVKIEATCKGEITSIDIDDSLLVVSEKEVLEDLIVSAFKNAKKNADTKMDEEMKKITDSLGIPPNLLKSPF